MTKDSGNQKPDYSSWPYVDRRKRRTNPIQTAVAVITGLGWLGFISFFAVLDQASPQQTSFWHIILKTPVRSVWDTGMVRNAFLVLALSFAAGLTGLLLNLTRSRRKSDRLSWGSLLLLGAVAVSGCFFLFYFGGMPPG